MAKKYLNATPEQQAMMNKLAARKVSRARRASTKRTQRQANPLTQEKFDAQYRSDQIRDRKARDAYFNDATQNPGYADRQAEGQRILDRKASIPAKKARQAALRKTGIENQSRRQSSIEQARRGKAGGYGPASPDMVNAGQFGLGVGGSQKPQLIDDGVARMPIPGSPEYEKWKNRPSPIDRGPYRMPMPGTLEHEEWSKKPGFELFGAGQAAEDYAFEARQKAGRLKYQSPEAAAVNDLNNITRAAGDAGTMDYYKYRANKRKHRNGSPGDRGLGRPSDTGPVKRTPEQDKEVQDAVNKRMDDYHAGLDAEAKKRYAKLDDAKARREISAMIGSGQYSDADIEAYMRYLEDPAYANTIMGMSGVSLAVKDRIRSNAEKGVGKRGMFVDPVMSSGMTEDNYARSGRELTTATPAEQEEYRRRMEEKGTHQRIRREVNLAEVAERNRTNPYASGIYAGRGGTQSDIDAGFGSAPSKEQPQSEMGTYFDPKTQESKQFKLMPLDQWFSEKIQQYPDLLDPLSKIKDQIDKVSEDKRYRPAEKEARIAELEAQKRKLADNYGYSTEPPEGTFDDPDDPEPLTWDDMQKRRKGYQEYRDPIIEGTPVSFEEWQSGIQKDVDAANGVAGKSPGSDPAASGAGVGDQVIPSTYTGPADPESSDFSDQAFNASVESGNYDILFKLVKTKDGKIRYVEPKKGGKWIVSGFGDNENMIVRGKLGEIVGYEAPNRSVVPLSPMVVNLEQAQAFRDEHPPSENPESDTYSKVVLLIIYDPDNNAYMTVPYPVPDEVSP